MRGMSEKHTSRCCVRECPVYGMPPQLPITVQPGLGESGTIVIGALCEDHAQLSLKEAVRLMDHGKVGHVVEKRCDICRTLHGFTRDVFVGAMRMQICTGCFDSKPVAAVRKAAGR